MQFDTTFIILILYAVQGNEPNLINGKGQTIEQSNSVNVSCGDDYVWNITLRKCSECKPGFVGRECSTKCHYPYYGYLCTKECENCNETCDHRTGCPETDTIPFPIAMRQTHLETLRGVTKESTESDSITLNHTESGHRRKHTNVQRNEPNLTNGKGHTIEQSNSVNESCGDDYVWNTTLRKCSECKPGFVGRNCSKMCHYPYYGYLCSKECENCNETCDHRTGCPETAMRHTHWEASRGVTKQSTDSDIITLNHTNSGQTRKYTNSILNRKLRISVTTLGTACAALYMVYFGLLVRDKISTRNNLTRTNDISDVEDAYQNMLGSDIVAITFE